VLKWDNPVVCMLCWKVKQGQQAIFSTSTNYNTSNLATHLKNTHKILQPIKSEHDTVVSASKKGASSNYIQNLLTDYSVAHSKKNMMQTRQSIFSIQPTLQSTKQK
jgi:hypothetical protein